jgi:hypothetical protein
MPNKLETVLIESRQQSNKSNIWLKVEQLLELVLIHMLDLLKQLQNKLARKLDMNSRLPQINLKLWLLMMLWLISMVL